MTFLPDVNLWLALAVIEHEQHPAAIRWFEATGDDALAFCRITQMGLLRLLTNRSVMNEDTLTPEGAWRRLDHIIQDVEPIFQPEPADLNPVWRTMTDRTRGGSNFWTDAYLAAFARSCNFTFVTFDRVAAAYKTAPVLVLETR
jgi:uncharacterized protein